MGNFEEIKALVKRISGQDGVISIQRVYLDIFGDLYDAAVLSQCVFWSDKGQNEFGWFYKSLPDWRNEIGIKRSALETAINHLESCGVVETKVMSAGKLNSPTTHYRVNMDNLTALVINNLQEQLSRTCVRSVESSRSKKDEPEVQSADSSISDLLNPADQPAESSRSSYSRLHSRLQADAVGGLTDPVWEIARAKLKVALNGTFEASNPVLVAVDENPHKYTVLVSQNVPGLKSTISAAIEQGAKSLKMRRRIHVVLVTDWPGYTPSKRVKEIKPIAGSKVQAALADILNGD